MIAVLAIGLMLVFLALALAPMLRRNAAEERLERLGGRRGGLASASAAGPPDSGTGRALVSLRDRLGRIIAVFGRRQAERDVYASVRKRLLEAGFRGPNALAIYMGSRVFLAMALTGLSVVTYTAMGRAPSLLALLIPAMVGYVLPGIVVDRTRTARQSSIDRGLADAIDLMVICVEAGLGLRATLERVGNELRDREPVIASEFRAAVAEAEAGRGLFRALRSMADRTANKQLDTLVSLMIQTDRFGTPVAETLRMQGDSIRFNRMQAAEEAAQRAPIKMLAPSMLIFLAILIVVGGPALLTVRDSLGGGGG